jgi:hypothetical protein
MSDMTEKDEKNNQQENSSAPDDDLDSLSEEEKAAFEKILAEINAGDHEQAPDAESDPTPASGSDGPDEELSDDQQAALDKIMAEINARDQEQAPDAESDPTPASGSDGSNEKLSDDQQAALDKIMAEINAREGQSATDTDTVSERQPDPVEKKSPSQEADPDGETLSFDEFNEELDNLLSKAQQDATQETPSAEPVKENEPAAVPNAEDTVAASAPEMSSLKYGPAPQPDVPSSTDPDTDYQADGEDAPTNGVETSRPAYAVLQEIDPNQGSRADSVRKPTPKKPERVGFGRLSKIAVVSVSVLATVGLVYWGLSRWNQRAARIPESANLSPAAQSSVDPGALKIATDIPPTPVPRPEEKEVSVEAPSRQPDGKPLDSLRSDLAAAREQVAGKIEEITNLMAYYEEGIREEENKIKEVLQHGPIPSLEKALGNNPIDLSIRAIQRRHAYISKLNTPLEQLKASSEELLYLERRTQLFETLSQWIGSPSMPQYRQKIADRIQIHLKAIKELAVDNTQMDLPSKDSVWEEVRTGLEKAKALNARRLKRNAQDKRISQEICNGEFDRKYMLTHLSQETATCLVRWSGKDLYLNGLTELSPQAARILSQWPGEWLSLNGIKELSAEAAKYLSQWPGRRLSLNGLIKLSPQATAALSKWRGEQLEMIGLTSIGPWENYGTRLYLSETMRRKLQM